MTYKTKESSTINPIHKEVLESQSEPKQYTFLSSQQLLENEIDLNIGDIIILYRSKYRVSKPKVSGEYANFTIIGTKYVYEFID